MLYWGLKHNNQIEQVISSGEKPAIADFGNPFIRDATIVRIDIRVRNCIRTPQADENNPYFSAVIKKSPSGDDIRFLWFGLKSNVEVVALKLAANRPDIGDFGIHPSDLNKDAEVVRVEIKESGDYGDGNWHLL